MLSTCLLHPSQIRDAGFQVAEAKRRLRDAGVAVDDKKEMESRLAVTILHVGFCW